MSETNFNPQNINDTKVPRAERTESTNKSGGRSWDPDSSRFGLYKNAINNLLEDTHYQSAEELFDDVVEEFLDVAADGYAKFPTQMATYARHEGGYRDIAQVLLVLSANLGRRELKGGINPTIANRWNKLNEWAKVHRDIIVGYTPMIIDRMDEFNTVTALQLALFGKPIPRPLRRGLTNALHKRYAIVRSEDTGETRRVTYIEEGNVDSDNIPVIVRSMPAPREVIDEGYVFDDYTAAKYLQKNHEVSLIDVINLVRPEPRSENREELFGRIVRGELDAPEHEDIEPLRNDRTWEAERSSDTTMIDVTVTETGVETDSPVLDTYRQRRPAISAQQVEFDVGDGEIVDIIVEDEDMIMDSGTGVFVRDEDLVDEEYEVPITVEADLDESAEWRHRLDDMGLMARVRNLRNMLQAGLHGREVFDYDGNGQFGDESERRVQEHQMFPFRYYQAYKACANIGGFRSRRGGFEITTELLDDDADEWLNRALDASIENLPDEFDSTFTAVDLSGSMDQAVANESELARAEIATLFGAIVTKYGGDVGAFGDAFATIDVDDRARRSMGSIDLAREIYQMSDRVGNRTNGWKALKWAIENEEAYDRFVFFTDEQIWDSGRRSRRSLKEFWDDYLDQVNPDAHLYVIDLASYGDLSVPQGARHVHQISGWNSDVIEFIDKNEKADQVIAEIGEIEPGDY